MGTWKMEQGPEDPDETLEIEKEKNKTIQQYEDQTETDRIEEEKQKNQGGQ